MKIKSSFGLVIIFMLISSVSLAAEEARVLRFPTVSGDAIVFSYAGDLFTVPIAGGTARRLTSHEGYEAFPRFSPDGRSIAFTGEYDGNREVYLMPSGRRRPEAPDVHALAPARRHLRPHGPE